MNVKTLSIYAAASYRWAKNLLLYGESGALVPLSISGAASASNNTIYSNGQVVGTMTPGGWGTYQTYYAINIVLGGSAYTTAAGSRMTITFTQPMLLSKAIVELYTHASYPNTPQMEFAATSDTGSVVKKSINATTVSTAYELVFPMSKYKVVVRGDKYYYRRPKEVPVSE